MILNTANRKLFYNKKKINKCCAPKYYPNVYLVRTYNLFRHWRVRRGQTHKKENMSVFEERILRKHTSQCIIQT